MPPGASFGQPDKLRWIEKTMPVKPRHAVNMMTIWDALYRSIRQVAAFPISLAEAVEVMQVVSLARNWKEKAYHESSGHQETGRD